MDLLIGNDNYLDMILPPKIEIQPGLYMLGSKSGWVISGRTRVTTENTTESNMLILTHGQQIQKETTFLTCVDKSLPMKPH